MAKNTKISIPMAVPGPKTIVQVLDFKKIVDDAIPKVINGITIVDWEDGTDEEIVAMINGHYEGKINLYDYWDVGDRRVVHLNDMEATEYAVESHAAQDVTLVLMNKGGKTLVTPINGITECAFIVGQKEYLQECGTMNLTKINRQGWDGCARRAWCNSTYKDAIPSTLVSIFKQHQNITGQGSTNQSAITVSNDYFALPSEKEIFGAVKYANAEAETSNTQFQYYKNIKNRNKPSALGTGYTYNEYWERSPYDETGFCMVDEGVASRFRSALGQRGISPFGVI